jgi:hypothetical protein
VFSICVCNILLLSSRCGAVLICDDPIIHIRMPAHWWAVEGWPVFFNKKNLQARFTKL